MNMKYIKTTLILIIVSVLVLGCVKVSESKTIEYPTRNLTTLFVEDGVKFNRFHDDELSATCWTTSGSSLIIAGGGISCIPDSQLRTNN